VSGGRAAALASASDSASACCNCSSSWPMPAASSMSSSPAPSPLAPAVRPHDTAAAWLQFTSNVTCIDRAVHAKSSRAQLFARLSTHGCALAAGRGCLAKTVPSESLALLSARLTLSLLLLPLPAVSSAQQQRTMYGRTDMSRHTCGHSDWAGQVGRQRT
jgi:hypothetical protein